MGDNSIENKVVEDWIDNKDIFDNLQIGNIIKTRSSGNKKLVCSKEEQDNSIMLCSRFPENQEYIQIDYYSWERHLANIKDTKYLHNAEYHERKWIYERMDRMLTERGL